MKISFYFSPSELRAMNTVKEIFGISGINYENILMDKDKVTFIGNNTSGKTFHGNINEGIVSGILYTIAKYDREIKSVCCAVKAYAKSIACLMSCGMIDELGNVMKRNRKYNINLKKNYKH